MVGILGVEEGYCPVCQETKDTIKFQIYNKIRYPSCTDCQTNHFSYLIVPDLIPIVPSLRIHAARYMLLPAKNTQREDRGYLVSVKPEDIEHMISSHCPASGWEYDYLGYMRYWKFPTPSPKELSVDLRRTPSLDRIDNALGYEGDNNIVVAYGVNTSKGAYDIDMYEQIGRFYRNLIDGGESS